jgi:hypothetical protein
LRNLSRITFTIGFAITLAAPTASDAAEIKVLTSRAMNHVLTELAGAFQRTSEHKIALILAPPAEIRRRILNDEIVDVASGAAGHERDFGRNCHDRKRAGRRQDFVEIPDLARRRSGHQGDRHGAGRLVKV